MGERKGFGQCDAHTETPTPVPPKMQDSGASGCGMKMTSLVHGAPLPSRPGLHRQTGRAWVCPETEEPDIDCTDAINAFAKPNWEQKQAALEVFRQGRRSLISPTARQVICAKRSPLRREKASGCTLPLRDCMRHG